MRRIARAWLPTNYDEKSLPIRNVLIRVGRGRIY